MVLGWGKKAENHPETDEEMSMEEILASIRKYVSTDQQTQSQQTVQQEPQASMGYAGYQHPPQSSASPRLAMEEEVSPYKLDPKADQGIGIPSLKTPQSASPDIGSMASYGDPYAPPPENVSYTYSQDYRQDLKPEIPPSILEHPVTASMVSRFTSEGMNTMKTNEETDGLLSTGTMNATSQAFSKLIEATRPIADKASPAQSIPAVTLDQLIADLARPMIKNWVDQNLSKLVESMVSQEIEKITGKLR